MMTFLNYLIMMVFFLISIAFYTIMERKLLGTFQLRMGPAKVGSKGMFQPFADMKKLFTKNMSLINKINEFIWNISPALLTLTFFFILMFLPLKMESWNLMMNFVLFMYILSLPLIWILFSSLFSSSNYSIISFKRCIAQMISYEMGFMMIFIFLILVYMKFNIEDLLTEMKKLPFTLKLLISTPMFLVVLSETSRMPFDFIESESELISGFNIEYSSLYFSLFFIYEYGMLLFFSIFMSFFMGSFYFTFIFMYMFIQIRNSFPRLRYDQMMLFFWKHIFFIIMTLFFLIN